MCPLSYVVAYFRIRVPFTSDDLWWLCVVRNAHRRWMQSGSYHRTCSELRFGKLCTNAWHSYWEIPWSLGRKDSTWVHRSEIDVDKLLDAGFSKRYVHFTWGVSVSCITVSITFKFLVHLRFSFAHFQTGSHGAVTKISFVLVCRVGLVPRGKPPNSICERWLANWATARDFSWGEARCSATQHANNLFSQWLNKQNFCAECPRHRFRFMTLMR